MVINSVNKLITNFVFVYNKLARLSYKIFIALITFKRVFAFLGLKRVFNEINYYICIIKEKQRWETLYAS